MQSGTDSNNLHFTGKERDVESGLDYFGARYYASSIGRFLSPDWSAKEEAVPYAKIDNPQSLNLYGYVANNPRSKVDNDGHQQGGPPPQEEVETEGREEAEVDAAMRHARRQANTEEFNKRAKNASSTGPELSPDEVASAQAAGREKLHEAINPAGDLLDKLTLNETDKAIQTIKVFSVDKQALVDMAKTDKKLGMTEDDMNTYKELNKTLPDPFPEDKVRGPEKHTRGLPSSQARHGHVGPVDHIPIKDRQ